MSIPVKDDALVKGDAVNGNGSGVTNSPGLDATSASAASTAAAVAATMASAVAEAGGAASSDLGVSGSGYVSPGGTQHEAVEIKLFVGRVPRSYEEEQLRPIFEEFGSVLEVAILKDKATQQHKGSAFVRMASITQADAAIRALNDVRILETTLGAMNVRYATREGEKFGFTNENGAAGQDQVKLFVGSLARTTTDREVEAIFSKYGKIDEIFLLKDPATNLNKGCAFVKFAYKEQAIRAIKAVNGFQTLPGASRPVEVRVAESKKNQMQNLAAGATGVMGMGAAGRGVGLGAGGFPFGGQMGAIGVPGAAGGQQVVTHSNANPRQGGPWKEYFTQDGRPYYHHSVSGLTQWERPAEFDKLGTAMARAAGDVTGPPGANIFVFHIPNDWGQNDLVSSFQLFGTIISARIATDKSTNRNKGYAFVSYDNIHSAAQAVIQMNGFMAGQKRLKVSIKQHEEKYVAHLIPQGSPSMGAGGGGMGVPGAAAGGAPGMGFTQGAGGAPGGAPMYGAPGVPNAAAGGAQSAVVPGMGVMNVAGGNPMAAAQGQYPQPGAAAGGLGQMTAGGAQQQFGGIAPPQHPVPPVQQQPGAAANPYGMQGYTAVYGGAATGGVGAQPSQRYAPY